MKKIILSMLIALSASCGFAEENPAVNPENFELTTLALQLLGEKVKQNELNANEKLEPILQEFGNYVGEVLLQPMTTRDLSETDYTGPVKNFKSNCAVTLPTETLLSQTAECTLIILYKTTDSKKLTFSVQLNINNQPISIIGNNVVVTNLKYN